MKIIVLAQELDNHTAPIKWALEQAGYQVACWAGLSWTEQQQASLLLDEQSELNLGPFTVEPGDAVWIRRPDPPMQNPKVSEHDKKFAEFEYLSFYQAVAHTLETLPVRCINKFSARNFIHNKSVQLRLARACGLKVPRTLMSNSPRAIKKFFDHNPSRTICKGFNPHTWQQGDTGGVAVTETFELTREQLPVDEILTYAPAIYQEMVVKQFDVRTVIMGNRIYSCALHNSKKSLDWRQDAGRGTVEVEVVATPPEVEQGILNFVQKAGICFGSMDFAVDTSGTWWFLEINEQGQFLWLDQFSPEAKLQEKFCAFITNPEGSARSIEERQGLFPSFAQYLEIYEKTLEAPDLISVSAANASRYISREP
jgi:glutathione synthase/RimK-type ligase-like ATP-grasp enzyme